MAQSQLTAAAGCGVILAAGVAAEVAWPRSTALLTAADYAVGLTFAVCGAWLMVVGRSWGWISMATAAGWFAGTAAAAASWLPPYLSDVAALGYRAFLLHLLTRAISQPPANCRRPVIAAGYLAVLLPAPADGLATAAMMAGLAVLAARAARRSPADRRPALTASAFSAAALALIWALAAAGVAAGAAADLANDLALVAAAVVLAAGWAREDWLRTAISSLVIELGPSPRPAGPISALLADALADPDLEVRYSVPGLGWLDERGQRVATPPDHRVGPGKVTRVAAPDGGEVVLVHGPAAAAAGQALPLAAASAAALALDSARIGAEVSQQARAVRESRRRLLTVADAERKALEARLQAAPVGRLRRVDENLAKLGDQAAQDIRSQLATALDDLTRLARGLYPGQLGARPLEKILKDLTAGMPIPVHVVAEGPLGCLAGTEQALAYFFCSECLANVARHAHATTATVHVGLDSGKLTISVLDDGQGGAEISSSRGLRGLADRVGVAGGLLTVQSPPGGPTSVRADVPVRSPLEPGPAAPHNF
jgi:signal transduction histidine kinase